MEHYRFLIITVNILKILFIYLKVTKINPLHVWSSLFFFKIIFAIIFPLSFHMNFKISLSISAKILAGIFIGITLNLQINLGSIAILTIFSLLIYAHGMFFHFCRSLISFNNILQFQNISFKPLLSNLFLWLNLFLSNVFFLMPSQTGSS